MHYDKKLEEQLKTPVEQSDLKPTKTNVQTIALLGFLLAYSVVVAVILISSGMKL